MMQKLSVVMTLLKMQLKFIFFQKRIFFILIVLCVPIILTLLGQSNGIRKDNFVWYLGLYYAFYVFIIPAFLSILYNGSIIHTELEAQTLTYLFTRPQPRWTIILGLYVGVTFSLMCAVTVSILINWLITGSIGGIAYLITLVHISCLGMIVYGALFFLLGIVFPEKSTVTGIIYALIIEGVISFVPAVISKMTISYHLRMMYLKILDDGDRAQIFRRLNIDFSEYTAWKLWAIMIVVTIVLLVLTSLVVTSREYNKNQPGQ